MKKVLVTGAAGFIGFHLARRLLAEEIEVVAVDNLNDYYDVRLKEDRLRLLQEQRPSFHFLKADIADRDAMAGLFSEHRPDTVIHLAAQAGVRYSLVNPHAYIDSNLVGFLNVLEGCRRNGASHLVFASSSSVYGGNTRLPFSTRQNVDHPLSLYAATKKSNEMMAHAYAALYGIPCTGLRFFTVYGPWGRPDMALFLFTSAILEGRPIEIFNEGRMERDFTYIDDIIEGVLRTARRPSAPDPHWDPMDPDPAGSSAPYRLYNIGNSRPVNLLTFIGILERELGKRAERILMPMQPGDVPATFADVDDLSRDVGFAPDTPVEEGIRRFVAWYRDYYRK
jgi:UDP-glucuronate 4-epimerase